MQESGLSDDNLTIEAEVWPTIVRPLGFDAGIRSLERNIERICRKVALYIVSGKAKHIHLNEENLREFLPMQ
jgi:ATP-dependent Lon protease